VLRASVDIGANSVRLLVVRMDGAAVELVHDTGVLTRLGDSLAESGRIEGGPLERTIRVVADYAATARELGAAVFCYATAGVRDASNAAEGLAALDEAARCAVRVVTGDEEARLNLLGVRAGMRPPPDRSVILDIGGGSTEIAWGDEEPKGGFSVPIGARKMLSRVPGLASGDRVPPEAMASASAAMLDALAGRPAPPAEYVDAIASGVGGTITALAALHLGLRTYEPLRLNGTWLSVGELAELAARLSGMTPAGRRDALFEPERADLILPGLAIALACLRWLRRDGLVVSIYGPRLGVLTDRGIALLAEGS